MDLHPPFFLLTLIWKFKCAEEFYNPDGVVELFSFSVEMAFVRKKEECSRNW